MNCSEFRKYVSDFISDDIKNSKAIMLSQHALECQECGKLLFQLRHMTVSLRSIGNKHIPDDCWSAVSVRISTMERKPLFGFQMWKYIAVPAAVALLLAGFVYMTPRDNTSQFNTIAATSSYSDYINIHAGASVNQPLSDSDFYLIAAGMQDVGDR